MTHLLQRRRIPGETCAFVRISIGFNIRRKSAYFLCWPRRDPWFPPICSGDYLTWSQPSQGCVPRAFTLHSWWDPCPDVTPAGWDKWLTPQRSSLLTAASHTAVLHPPEQHAQHHLIHFLTTAFIFEPKSIWSILTDRLTANTFFVFEKFCVNEHHFMILCNSFFHQKAFKAYCK